MKWIEPLNESSNALDKNEYQQLQLESCQAKFWARQPTLGLAEALETNYLGSMLNQSCRA